jgi:hypothetical protein
MIFIMEKKIQELFAEFTQNCVKEGFEPHVRMIMKPEVADTISKREQRIVDTVASTYLTAEIYPKPLPHNSPPHGEKSEEGAGKSSEKKSGGKKEGATGDVRPKK